MRNASGWQFGKRTTRSDCGTSHTTRTHRIRCRAKTSASTLKTSRLASFTANRKSANNPIPSNRFPERRPSNRHTPTKLFHGHNAKWRQTSRQRFGDDHRQARDPACNNHRRGTGPLTGCASSEGPKSDTNAPSKGLSTHKRMLALFPEDSVCFVLPDTQSRRCPQRRSEPPHLCLPGVVAPHQLPLPNNPAICLNNKNMPKQQIQTCLFDKNMRFQQIQHVGEIETSDFSIFSPTFSRPYSFGHTFLGRNFQHPIYHIRTKNISIPTYTGARLWQ